MAHRQRYRGGAGHHTPVERAGVIACDSGSHDDRSMLGSEARKSQKGKN